MHDADKIRFRDLMEELGGMYGQDIAGKLKPYWRVLSTQMEIDTFAAAIDAHMADAQRGRFFPLPADLIAACPAHGGHPSADEAWAVCLESFDESASVTMTAQMIEARSVAMPIMDDGDKVGARMAFRAAYERIVRAAPAMPKWQFSPGHDYARRAEAAERAVKQGLLPAKDVQQHMPAPAVTPDGAAIAGLLTGRTDNVVGINADVRAKLAKVRSAIAQAATDREQEREAREAQRHAQAEANYQRRHGPQQQEAK